MPENEFVRASLVKLDPFLKTLGRPTRENVTTNRDANASLLQAIMFSNNDFLYQNIKTGANQLLTQYQSDVQLSMNALYQNALGRSPTAKEEKLVHKQLKNTTKEAVMEDLIWSVLALPEFQFL